MFAWLKRRQLNEHKKLLFQNIAAATYLIHMFERNDQSEHEITLTMRRNLKESERAAQAFNGEDLIPHDEASKLLDINSELRKVDHYVFQSVTHFDKAYQPSEGWDDYYSNFPLAGSPRSGEST